jgi:hypothetical protein
VFGIKHKARAGLHLSRTEDYCTEMELGVWRLDRIGIYPPACTTEVVSKDLHKGSIAS